MSPGRPNQGSNQENSEELAATFASFTNINGEQSGSSSNWEDERLVGTTLGQHYEILDLIGHGGMSTVYKAQNLLTKRIIAVKLMRRHLLNDTHSKERFRREAVSSSRLNHQNCITIYDMGLLDDNCPYLVMDYLQGVSLADLIQRSPGKHVSIDRFLNIFRQVTDAVAHAHERGVLHRDLKPGNIMIVDQNGHDVVKVVDFGIAKIISDIETDALKLTNTGDVFGSPLYMSPEQCQGFALDARSDIYSIGCTMYEALTGHPPLEGTHMMDTLYKQTNVVPEGLGKLDTDSATANALNEMVMKSLSKKPERRQQTVAEMGQELQQIQKTHSRKLKLWNPFAKIQMKSRETHRNLNNFVGGRWSPIMVFGVLFFIAGTVALEVYFRSQYKAPSIETRVIPIEVNMAKMVKSKYPPREAAVDISGLRMVRIAARKDLGLADSQDWYHLVDDADMVKAYEVSIPQPRWELPSRMYEEAIKLKQVLNKAGVRLAQPDVARMFAGEAETNELQHAAGQKADLPFALDCSREAVRIYSKLVTDMYRPQELCERARLCRMLALANKPNSGEYMAMQRMLDDNVLKNHYYNSPELASSLSQLGDHFFNDKAYDVAVRDYLLALEAWSQCANSQFNVAATENQLGMSLEFFGAASPNGSVQAKCYAEAASSFDKSYALLRTVPGDHESSMVGVLYNKADVLWRQGHLLKALWVENSEARKLQMQIGASPK